MSRLDYTNDNKADERLNPAEETSSILNDAEKETGTNDLGEEKRYPDFISPKNDTNSLRDKEESQNNIPYERTNRQSISKNSSSKSVKALLKKKGPAGLVIGLLVGGGMFAGVMGPSLAGIAFAENTLRDVNDKLAALTEGNNKIMRNKLIKSARGGALKGCGKLSLRCKMKTFSKTEILRMERSGIKVVSDGKNPLGRTRAKGVEFKGKFYTADEWFAKLKTDSSARNAQLRANNMKYRGLSTRGPFGKVLSRFGISKKAPGLKGSRADRANQLMTAAGVDNPNGVKFLDVVDSEGEKTGKSVLAEPGEDGTVKEDSVKDRYQYTSEEVNSSKKSLERVASAKPPSKTKKAALGAASILGVADLVCSIKNMVVGATVAAKVMNEAALIKYAIPILSSIGKIKSGEASPEDAETIGNFLTEVDSRKQIEGIEIAKGEDKPTPALVNNPEYGRSAMDSRLLSMSTNNKTINPTETTSQYAVGIGIGSLLSASGVSNFMSDFNTYSGTACKVIQHPLTRFLGIVVSVVVGVASAGSITAGQVAFTAGLMIGMYLIEQALNYAMSGSVTSGLIDSKVGRGEALWTGTASLEAATSRQMGLMPRNTEDIRKYSYIRDSVDQQYIAMEKEDAKNRPFDIKNQYSFIGSIARSIFGNFGYSGRPINIISGMATTAMGVLSPIRPTFAKTFDAARFEKCDDAEYLKMGINADIQCNVRYVMPEEDLALEPDDVVDWMENVGCGGKGCVEKDSETGLPEGYTPPNEREAQNLIMGIAKDLTIGQFIDSRNLSNDYSKYLEACVYRVAPYGQTGEESGLIGGLGDWEDGKKCAEKGTDTSYYRMYTLYRSVVDTTDEDEEDGITSESTSTSENNNQAVADGNMGFVVDKSYYDKNTNLFTKPHGGASSFTGQNQSIDIGLPKGVPVYAMLGGKVIKRPLGRSDRGCPGNPNSPNNGGLMIESQYQGKTVRIAYAHGENVTTKDTVSAGDQIMTVGQVGNACGPHIHMDFDYGGSGVCLQQIFPILAAGNQPNLSELAAKATINCK